MTIIQEIHAWSKDLPAWQQDAIARLYVNRELLPQDLDDLFALAKSEAGIPDEDKREPKKLEDAEVAPPANPTRLVQILAVRELENVNALVPGGRLPIAEEGITAIYGENGAGKSGYSRVFKHACRARDRREPILPDARQDPKAAGPARATFESVVDGTPINYVWQHKAEPPEPLADISIFDTHCAQAYIDNHGDFAYVPYGLDILEGLVGVCNKLKARATQEKTVSAASDAGYAALVKEQTAVAKALNAIPGTTTREDIERLATLSPEEAERRTLLVKTLSEAEPKVKARALRQKSLRLKSLKERIDSAVDVLSNQKLAELRELIDKSNTAKKTAELAAQAFKDSPGLLPGTGDEEWKALFEAARAFATLSHEGHTFLALPDDSQCPLCQNPLGKDGVQRLAEFEAFVQGKVEQAAKTARTAAVNAFNVVKGATVKIALDDALTQELAELDAALLSACTAMEMGLVSRQTEVVQAAGGKLDWDTVAVLPDDPRAKLTETVGTLETQAKALEATADEKARAAMAAERLEFDARFSLNEVKKAVLEAITKHEHCAKLQKCIDGMDARGISRKSTELSRTLASKELADALNEELRRLKCHDLQVVMKPESPAGRTQFKLTLQLPGGGTPAAILSEGEQRAIAIASFLAEIKLGKGRGGVVFDDPVSSLDHRRRWEVAERLAAESLVRQVIVFTHDIYFLCILEQKAQELGAKLTTNYIRRTAAGFGAHSDELPFDVLGTKGRIGRLKQMLQAVQKAHKDGEEDTQRALTARTYGRLRLAWERGVEEVLFNGAIQRFGEGVSTQRLKEVTVSDDDYRAIDAGMTKSSKFEHDAAMGVGRLPVPHPDELSMDIENFESWRSAILKRNNDVRAARA
ncbi:recombination protein F [Caballeronia pedi]|uniref:Recombination protein F n=1 Tax=Caballeronia pedi TaxID=1777141 RepID=A0A157ZTX0_9BURK|nr:AAA family ATPase [Caballeronia pedi]SAK48919.1 recombination protein F [Caballeronia pedi]